MNSILNSLFTRVLIGFFFSRFEEATVFWHIKAREKHRKRAEKREKENSKKKSNTNTETRERKKFFSRFWSKNASQNYTISHQNIRE